MGNVLQSASSDTPEKYNVDFEKKKNSNNKSEKTAGSEKEHTKPDNHSPNSISRSGSSRSGRSVPQHSRGNNDFFRPKSEKLRSVREINRGGNSLPRMRSESSKLGNTTSGVIIVDEANCELHISENAQDRRINRKDMQLLINIQGQDEVENDQGREVIAHFGKDKRVRVKSELRVRFEDEVREHFQSRSRHVSLENSSLERGISAYREEALRENSFSNVGNNYTQRPLSDIPVRSKERQLFQRDKPSWNSRMCRTDSYQDTTFGLTVQSVSRLSRSMGQVTLKEDLGCMHPKDGDVLGECYAIGKARRSMSNSLAAQCVSRFPINEVEEPDKEYLPTEECNKQPPPSNASQNPSPPGDSPPPSSMPRGASGPSTRSL